MMQKFIDKKRSVGYSHPPIHTDGKARFRVYMEKGLCYRVTVEPWELSDELEEIQNQAA